MFQGNDLIFLLLLSAWWLRGLPNSQDGGTHFSAKSPVIVPNHRTFFCLSLQVHLQSGGQFALSLSHWLNQRVRGGSRVLEGLLLANMCPNFRAAHSLAVRKATVVISEVSRDSRQAQARYWRMATTCPFTSVTIALPLIFPVTDHSASHVFS